ncbi:hypothetical protein [Aggregatibacter actinomycetemcomitans]|uniref:hypothetical protein n=1 Tax=Aggregatibacter actinomycetemcomitans TaxID=714 RepID=UPI000AFB2561|nr:hypothetical protein [Aggregatibacter actinomycetemcomitans]QPQ81262.1 hypothetical protein I6H05_02755 [Aggregatibacter actinomycetemcomitans]TYA22386.1 hypothetical protein FXB91_10440 [Aggregatibacter actinomycetemcomitans]TYA26295.1 hypothetical protein FXB92_10055 [Aggregatibacter actinomycetemcomitans]TYA28225.1 hypothetical protein FXB96_10225 [Aggregatibacter actinomycetemcomitans]TYA36113.1 hypothetical protein FXE06_09940 [Aggregatibacter actinomycetemcomitans]
MKELKNQCLHGIFGGADSFNPHNYCCEECLKAGLCDPPDSKSEPNYAKAWAELSYIMAAGFNLDCGGASYFLKGGGARNTGTDLHC